MPLVEVPVVPVVPELLDVPDVPVAPDDEVPVVPLVPELLEVPVEPADGVLWDSTEPLAPDGLTEPEAEPPTEPMPEPEPDTEPLTLGDEVPDDEVPVSEAPEDEVPPTEVPPEDTEPEALPVSDELVAEAPDDPMPDEVEDVLSGEELAQAASSSARARGAIFFSMEISYVLSSVVARQAAGPRRGAARLARIETRARGKVPAATTAML